MIRSVLFVKIFIPNPNNIFFVQNNGVYRSFYILWFYSSILYDSTSRYINLGLSVSILHMDMNR